MDEGLRKLKYGILTDGLTEAQIVGKLIGEFYDAYQRELTEDLEPVPVRVEVKVGKVDSASLPGEQIEGTTQALMIAMTFVEKSKIITSKLLM